MAGVYIWRGRFGEEKNFLYLPGYEPYIAQLVASHHSDRAVDCSSLSVFSTSCSEQ